MPHCTNSLVNTRSSRSSIAAASCQLLLCALWALTGCDQQPAEFEPNVICLRKQKVIEGPGDLQTEATQLRLDDVRRVMTLYFGTPDEPRLPEVPELAAEFDLDLLRRTAGPGTAPGGQRGLFRQLCARCHGLAGSGMGPEAAQLDPYPRDYRRGIFKFKSTPSTLPPTKADLHNVLVRGIPGTAMPSFRLLGEVDREALVQYVRYLSIRGLYERAIIEEAAFELEDDQYLLDPDLRDGSLAKQQQLEILDDVLGEVITPWLDADNQIVTAPPRPDDYASESSVARGRELFFTTLANCATCHGATALGDGQTEDYDEWSKELDPASPTVLADYLALGALPPRKTRPRNLREGVYRGGHTAEELFVKVKNGIAGTTMPEVAAQLTDADIWHLVAYALSAVRPDYARPTAPRRD